MTPGINLTKFRISSLQQKFSRLALSVYLQMTNPAIQNDFSYYRRTLSRMKMAGDVSTLVLDVFSILVRAGSN